MIKEAELAARRGLDVAASDVCKPGGGGGVETTPAVKHNPATSHAAPPLPLFIARSFFIK